MQSIASGVRLVDPKRHESGVVKFISPSFIIQRVPWHAVALTSYSTVDSAPAVFPILSVLLTGIE